MTSKPAARRAAQSPPVKLPLATSVGHQVRATHRALQRLLQMKIRAHGITPGMWYFLRVLWEEDGLSQRELSDRVGAMAPTTLTAIVAMEKAGLVRRRKDQADRRRLRIELTARGRALEQVLLPQAAEVVEVAVDGFTAAERRALLAALGRIQQNIDSALKRTP